MSRVPIDYRPVRLFDALGARTGELPQLDTSEYQPVMVMADFSKTLSSEPIEARALAGEWIDGVAGKYAAIAVHVRSAGGIVVEDIRLRHPGLSLTNIFATVNIRNSSGLGGVYANVVSLGGRDVYSVVEYGTRNNPYTTDAATITADRDSKSCEIVNQRFYVPPGKFFCASSTHVNTGVGFVLVWREIPEPVGST